MTQHTSGGAVTAVTNCCANCVETSRPSNGGTIYRFFGKPVMRARWMAGAAPHKSRLCRDKSRSNNHTQASLDLRYLSQLRSGYCKLLNFYKKRLKQTDSSSCTDCGMDPQDVPHLFNCTALTPEHLWNRPVKTMRELSFLDPENLE